MKKAYSLSILIIIILCSIFIVACNNSPTDMETVTVYGEFYTLQQAFDKELLTEEQCEFIADNESSPEKFSDISKSDRDKILHDYKQLHPAASDDIDILSYGNYDGSCVVLVSDNYYGNAFSDTVNRGYYYVYNNKYRETVATYSFDFYFVRVWRECDKQTKVEKPQTPSGAFFTYKRAYELGLFDKDDWDSRMVYDEYVDLVPQDWAETESRIMTDYLLTEAEYDMNNKFGIYNPEAGQLSMWKTDVRFAGYLNGFLMIRMRTFYSGDAFQDVYTFEIAEGFTYEDMYPRGILWIPLDELNETSKV